VLLGSVFLGFQAYEYHHAYTELGLTMGAGAYGATFFMLTGFHGFHVTLGTIMLAVILLRSLSGHFSADRHFAFEGGGLVLALRRCGLADPLRLRLLGVTGNETEPEPGEQHQKERNRQPDAQGQRPHRPLAGPPVAVEIEEPGEQAADYGQQQQNDQQLEHG
jgi:hypothetical protein